MASGTFDAGEDGCPRGQDKRQHPGELSMAGCTLEWNPCLHEYQPLSQDAHHYHEHAYMGRHSAQKLFVLSAAHVVVESPNGHVYCAVQALHAKVHDDWREPSKVCVGTSCSGIGVGDRPPGDDLPWGADIDFSRSNILIWVHNL
eukprot:5598822-Amphidinium_carterae.1